MTLAPEKYKQLLDLIQKEFPDWTGSQDERFIKNETGYKREAAQLASELLSETEFKRLLDGGEYDELIRRLKKVGAKTNLLFLGVPRSGDLNILVQDGLDKPSYFSALFDLLYGPGESCERLDRYLAYITAHNLPNKWTFPTYFLYLLHPETEVYIRPRPTAWLVELLGLHELPSKPNAEFYEYLKNTYREIRVELKSFGLVDMIDIQSIVWAAYDAHQTVNQLGNPFNKIFKDWEQANWVFDRFQKTLDELGVRDPDDPLLTVTLTSSGNHYSLHLIYGNWLILGFRGALGSLTQIEIALPKNSLNIPPEYESDFQTKPNEPVVTYYRYLAETVQSFETKIEPAFMAGLKEIRAHFTDSKKSPYHGHHIALLAQGIFDLSIRNELLSEGLPTVDISKDGPDIPKIPIGGSSAFSQLAFELLEGIHKDPTMKYYQAHKEEIEETVIQPFQNLVHKIALRLPQPILDRMETEKNIYSRFNKNDYGRGGCWDHYWAAFYPKGSKRQEGAQLSLWLNYDHLSIVFHIGDYGTHAREQFRMNTHLYAATLGDKLADLITNPDVTLEKDRVSTVIDQGDGSRSQMSWDEWFQKPESTDYSVHIKLSPQEVLSTPIQGLEDQIVGAFSAFFPLVLLAIDADPLPAVLQYLGIDDGRDEPTIIHPVYPLDALSADTGFDLETIERWARAIERKGQAIFYGPPGTGKTYMAQALTRHLIGGGDGFSDLIQFHPAYSYEDFMQGIRPRRVEGGLDYPTQPGRFLNFCRKAETCSGRCVLIIDEINRANLARVFGELMYLLEYRDETISLAGGGSFRIPRNVRLLGTMNTADRSIALVDHALRRRFAFLSLYPNYTALQHYHQSHQTGFPVDALVSILRQLNEDVIQNPHYQVGISYFLRQDLPAQIADIWQMEIYPYLEEYFFDQPTTVREFRWEEVANQLGL